VSVFEVQYRNLVEEHKNVIMALIIITKLRDPNDRCFE